MDQVTNNLLKELEKTQHDFWNIAHETANFLSILIKSTNRKNMLEIGTSNGYSGIWFGKALKENGGHLTTIEFYEERQSMAKENFKTCGVDDVITPIQGSAVMVLENMPEDQEFDIVFIDANKKEYIKYFNLTDKMLRKGGIIVADNVLSHAEKVKDFVDAINADERYQVETLTLPAGLLLAYKVSE